MLHKMRFEFLFPVGIFMETLYHSSVVKIGDRIEM